MCTKPSFLNSGLTIAHISRENVLPLHQLIEGPLFMLINVHFAILQGRNFAKIIRDAWAL